MVLNGNGRQGAAAAAAARVAAPGYRIGSVGNAGSMTTRTASSCTGRGYEGEGQPARTRPRRPLVSPLDGMRPRSSTARRPS